jgi:hypothetical protein
MGRKTDEPGALDLALAIRSAVEIARAAGHVDLAEQLQAVLDELPRIISDDGRRSPQ